MGARKRKTNLMPVINKEVNLLDLGSGPLASRTTKHFNARRGRPGIFVSVNLDRELRVDGKDQVIRNGETERGHFFIKGNFIDFITGQRKESVRAVNDEGLLEHICLAVLQDNYSHGHAAPIERIKANIRTHLNGVFRVLKRNGRFSIVINGLFGNVVKEELQRAGFKIESAKRLTNEEISQGPSAYLKDTQNKFGQLVRNIDLYKGKFPDSILNLGHDPSTVNPVELIWPVRISCRKPKKEISN